MQIHLSVDSVVGGKSYSSLPGTAGGDAITREIYALLLGG